MAQERHPMLAAAFGDAKIDAGLEADFGEFMVGWVSAPDLTFQYSAEGWLDNSSLTTKTPLCPDAPAVYERRFKAAWAGSGRADWCWERLRELVRGVLNDLPDNPFARQHAWLVGLISDIPEQYDEMLDRLIGMIGRHETRARADAEKTAEAARTGQRVALRSWLTGACCNGHGDECSFDNATEYVLPDGSRKTEYVCCF